MRWFSYLNIGYRSYYLFERQLQNINSNIDCSDFIKRLYYKKIAIHELDLSHETSGNRVATNTVKIPEYQELMMKYRAYRDVDPSNKFDWYKKYINDCNVLVDMSVYRIKELVQRRDMIPPYWTDFVVMFDGEEMKLDDFRHICQSE